MRCTKTTNLEIHHIRRDGGNGLDNARVLCQKCHEATHSYGMPGKSSTDFDQDTKDKAKKKSWISMRVY
jgi:hypothetical protein